MIEQSDEELSRHAVTQPRLACNDGNGIAVDEQEVAQAPGRQEFVELYEDYIAIGYSTALRALGGANFKVLASQPDKERVIVTSRIQINGAAPIRVDWQLNPTNHGYKVTDVIVNGISMASTQHSDLISVVQRNGGQLPALLVALRDKNASNGILR